jgi:hypothetical protein
MLSGTVAGERFRDDRILPILTSRGVNLNEVCVWTEAEDMSKGFILPRIGGTSKPWKPVQTLNC